MIIFLAFFGEGFGTGLIITAYYFEWVAHYITVMGKCYAYVGFWAKASCSLGGRCVGPSYNGLWRVKYLLGWEVLSLFSSGALDSSWSCILLSTIWTSSLWSKVLFLFKKSSYLAESWAEKYSIAFW
jgi:hypothetical protein